MINKIDPKAIAKILSDPKQMEALRKRFSAFLPKMVKAPEDTKCLACNSLNMERLHVPLAGPFAGSVKCNDCGHTETVVNYLGKTCIEVTPLKVMCSHGVRDDDGSPSAENHRDHCDDSD